MSAVEKLTPALAANPKARALAKALDNKSEVAKALKNELEEVGDRPSRVKRAMSALSGAGMTGVLTGFTTNRNAKTVIALGTGIAGVIAGLVIDSDIVFDGATGAGCFGIGMATDMGTEKAVQGIKDAANKATSSEKPAEPAV